MAISSMTGFARSEGSYAETSWHWELRSVNGRGLDIRVRTPTGNDRVEQPVRQALAANFARGSITATLSVQRTSSATEIRLQEDNIGFDQDTPVILIPDDDLEWDHVVNAFNAVRRANLQSISFAARR